MTAVPAEVRVGTFTVSTCCATLAIALLVSLVALAVVTGTRPVPPTDYTQIPIVTDQAWDALTAQGWQWQLRTGKNPLMVAVLSDAPISPGNVFAMPFEGTQPDTEPMVVWHALPGAREVYVEYWAKFSASWECNPAGCGKMHFIWPSAGGDTYMGIYCLGTTSDPATTKGCNATDSPLQFGGQLQWEGSGYPLGVPIFANVTRAPIVRDRWHHYAAYYKWSSTPEARDGIWRWWVDGALNGDYTDIAYAGMGAATEFQFALTKQTVPNPPQQFLYVDHTILRAR